MIVKRENEYIDSAESMREMISNHKKWASQENDKSDAVWDEVEYEVYDDFQDSDKYKLSEHMGTMRECAGSSEEEEDTTTYETAVEEPPFKQGARTKYLTSMDFGEVEEGGEIFQYCMQMARGTVDRGKEIEERIAAMDGTPKDMA